MDAPIDEMSVACRLFEAPIHMADLRAVRDEGSGAAPELPVEACGWRLGGRVFGASGVMNIGFGADDSAGFAFAEIVAHRSEAGALASLKANLDETSAPLGSAGHGAAFPNVVGERFLTIDIQVVLNGGDELERVPLGGGGDDDCLEAVDLQEVLVMFESGGAAALGLFDTIGGLGQVITVDVGQGDEFDSSHAECGVDVGHTVTAAADQAEAQSLVRLGGLEEGGQLG